MRWEKTRRLESWDFPNLLLESHNLNKDGKKIMGQGYQNDPIRRFQNGFKDGTRHTKRKDKKETDITMGKERASRDK